MFLNGEQILQRLNRGDLVIDPFPDDSQIGTFTVDLRLGNQFRELPSPYSIDYITLDPYKPKTLANLLEKSRIISVDFGERIILHPQDYFLATTLEYIQLPSDLVAMTFLRSSLGRVGLVINSSTVSPSFQGKITLQLVNLGKAPVALYPGIRIVRIAFAEIEATAKYRGKFQGATELDFSKVSLDADLNKLRNLMLERARELQTKRKLPIAIRDLLYEALEAEGQEKGKKLERVATEIFRTIRGLKVIAVNTRLKAEELDIILKNDINVGFWRMLGSPVIVECKNWSRKVGAREISVLSDKLKSVSPDAKTGILIAPNGISGNFHSDAVLKIREKRIQGQYIIVLDRQDLEEIADGTHASIVIERKYDWLLLI